MAARTPSSEAPAAPVAAVGTFCTQDAHLVILTDPPPPSPSAAAPPWDLLSTIRLLAPEEGRDIIILGGDEVEGLLRKVTSALLRRHLDSIELGDRHGC